MNLSNTVEANVLEVLRDIPQTRYDDMLLILRYYNRFGLLPAGRLPLEDIAYNYKAYGLPCFETIRRARQRVQALFPELSRSSCAGCSDNVKITIEIGGKADEG